MPLKTPTSRGSAVRAILLSALGSVLLAIVAPLVCQAQALTPAEALKRFKVADGFQVELFASEPEVRQPVTMTFDARGRLWVIQYLQYPTPAGLKPVTVDRYLRTKYDRVPEPPPHGPRGVDRITILEDTDGDGRADRSKDFVTGLNLASALAIGNGGVYVGQAPYLLFYPDRNGDDVPDSDPEVLLTGFGLEDAHAVINSLQWGPDGWLYGAQGSTVTADIRGVGFQQGVWRYHPATKRFELFSEGGGNTWGLDFNQRGQVLAGTNYGERVCLHQVQGGYYVKGFSKHGPLHNPFTYGYFEHVDHQGHAGGHVTCGGIVYQGGAFPAEFNGTYVGANLLSNAIYYSALEPRGSTYKSRYLGTLLETDDIWFRPIDCLTGPDGAVYVADWYDQRANHVIPDDTWDRSNGRIWTISRREAKPAPKIDIAPRTSDELVDLLSHANAWHRREARRVLSERRDQAPIPRLQKIIQTPGDDRLALEALWALYVSGGWNETLALQLLDHPSADIRAWTVRLVGDPREALSSSMAQRLGHLAETEPNVSVRSQLACTAKRLPSADGLPIVARLLRRSEDALDPHLPLLLWWAIEDKTLADRDRVLSLFAEADAWTMPLVRDVIVQRVAKRYLAEGTDEGYETLARLLKMTPNDEALRPIVVALDQEFPGQRLSETPRALASLVDRLNTTQADDPVSTRLALRLGSQQAYQRALQRMADTGEKDDVRRAFVSVVGQSGREDASTRLLALLTAEPAEADAIRLAALGALEHFSDRAIGEAVLANYARWPAALRQRAIGLLCSRAAWSQLLVAAVASKQIDAMDVSLDQARQMLTHGNAELAAAIEGQWGKIRPATPGEKHAYVPVIGRILNEQPGDRDRGHQLFTKHCATCHTLFGEGNKIGPDLTSADRKNRDALLLNILDPSGYIRPEYVAQVAVLGDGRILTGMVTEATPQQVTLVDAKNQKYTLARAEIDELQPATLSLMPERLLEPLAPQEIRDLFRYLQGDPPAATSGK